MHAAAAGGHIQVIKFLLPYFGARVQEKDNCAYTMLHRAAQGGHCQVARYLIEKFQMDPEDRDMVCGVPREDMFQSRRSACIMHVCTCANLCNETCDKKALPAGRVYVLW